MLRAAALALSLPLALLAGGASADAGSAAMAKVKTGILPDGGFYSLYSLQCGGSGVASVASFEGRSRWCTSYGGELVCSRDAGAARERACSSLEVANGAASHTTDAPLVQTGVAEES